MNTFEAFLQERVGASYPIRSIIDNLTDEQIKEAIKEFVDINIKEKLESTLQVAIANRRFESNVDKVGFVYISQLEELLL